MLITSAVLLVEITHELLSLLHKALKALGNSPWLNTKELSDEVLTKWAERKNDLTPSQDKAYQELSDALEHYQEGQGSQQATIEAIAMLPTMAFLDNEITHLTGHPLSDTSDDRASITIKDYINDHVKSDGKNNGENIDYLSQPLGEFNRRLMEDHYSPIVVPVRDNGGLIGFCAPYTKGGNGYEMFIGLDDDRKSIVVNGKPVVANRISEEFVGFDKVPLDKIQDHGYVSAEMFLEQVHNEIEKLTDDMDLPFAKRLDAIANMTAQRIKEQNERELASLAKGEEKSVEVPENILSDAFNSLSEAFPLRNIPEELENFRLPFYSNENRILNVNLPIKDIGEIDHIDVRVITGDETGDIFLKSGQKIHFDAGQDRFVERNAISYTIPNEAIAAWFNLDLSKRTQQSASESRIEAVESIRKELKAKESTKPFADRSSGDGVLPDIATQTPPQTPVQAKEEPKKRPARASKNDGLAQSLLEKYTEQYAGNKELVSALSKDSIRACLDELDSNGKAHDFMDGFIDELDKMPKKLITNPKTMITLYDYKSNSGAEKAFNRFAEQTAKALETKARKGDISFNAIIKNYVEGKHQLLTQRTPKETIEQLRAEQDIQKFRETDPSPIDTSKIDFGPINTTIDTAEPVHKTPDPTEVKTDEQVKPPIVDKEQTKQQKIAEIATLFKEELTKKEQGTLDSLIGSLYEHDFYHENGLWAGIDLLKEDGRFDDDNELQLAKNTLSSLSKKMSKIGIRTLGDLSILPKSFVERQRILESIEKENELIIRNCGDANKTDRLFPMKDGHIDEVIINSCIDLIAEYGEDRFEETFPFYDDDNYTCGKREQLTFYETLQNAVFASKSDAEFSVALDEVFKHAKEVFPTAFPETPCEVLAAIQKAEMFERKIETEYGNRKKAPKEIKEQLNNIENERDRALSIKDGTIFKLFSQEALEKAIQNRQIVKEPETHSENINNEGKEERDQSVSDDLGALIDMLEQEEPSLSLTFYNIDDIPCSVELPVASLDEIDHISMKNIAYDETGDIFLTDGSKIHFDAGRERAESEPVEKYEISHDALKQLDGIKLISHADDPSQEKPLSEQRRIGVTVIQKRLDREAKQKQHSKSERKKTTRAD